MSDIINLRKRGYFGKEHKDADFGFAIVAHNVNHAQKLLYDMRNTVGEGEWNWIDLTIEWKRDAKIDHLPFGVIEDLRSGIETGIFTYIEDFECDECGHDGYVQLYNGKLVCESCFDKITIRMGGDES